MNDEERANTARKSFTGRCRDSHHNHITNALICTKLSRSIATRAAHKHCRIIAHLDEGVRTRIRDTLALAHFQFLDDAANSLDDTFGSSSNGSGRCKRSFAVDLGVPQHHFFQRFACVTCHKVCIYTHAHADALLLVVASQSTVTPEMLE